MHLRRERKIPNSKGRVNPNSLKWHGEKKHVQRHLKMNKIKLWPLSSYCDRARRTESSHEICTSLGIWHLLARS